MDVVELGRPERSAASRRPRRGWPLGVAAIVVLGAVGYAATRPDEPAPEARTSPAPVVSTATLPVSSPTPETVDASPPPDPYAGNWDLPRLRERTGLVFASAARTFTVMDLDSGRVTRTDVPSGGDDYVEPIGPIDGGWLVAHRTVCGDFPCDPAELYTVRGDRVRLVGRGDNAMLDPDGRTVWVTGLPPNPTDIDTALWVERRTLDGARIGRQTALRTDERVIGVTPRGPLVGTFYGEHAYLLDRSTHARREVVTGRIAVAVAGNEVATMTPGCTDGEAGTCRLAVENVATGRVRQVAVVDDRPHQFALDPSARYLAVSFESGDHSIQVYDVNAARHVPIQGLTFPPLAAAVTWSPDGRWLVMTHAKAGDDDAAAGATGVAIWHPGLESAFSVPEYPGIWADRTALVS